MNRALEGLPVVMQAMRYFLTRTGPLAVGGESWGPTYLYNAATGKLTATLKARGSRLVTDVALLASV